MMKRFFIFLSALVLVARSACLPGVPVFSAITNLTFVRTPQTESVINGIVARTQNYLAKNRAKHEARAFVISCIDYRLVNQVVQQLTAKGYENQYDNFVLAGASLSIAEADLADWKSALFEHIDIAIKLHSIQEVIMIDHMDCGMYKNTYPILKNPRQQIDKHLQNILKAKQIIYKKYPSLKVMAYVMTLEGEITRII